MLLLFSVQAQITVQTADLEDEPRSFDCVEKLSAASKKGAESVGPALLSARAKKTADTRRA